MLFLGDRAVAVCSKSAWPELAVAGYTVPAPKTPKLAAQPAAVRHRTGPGCCATHTLGDPLCSVSAAMLRGGWHCRQPSHARTPTMREAPMREASWTLLLLFVNNCSLHAHARSCSAHCRAGCLTMPLPSVLTVLSPWPVGLCWSQCQRLCCGPRVLWQLDPSGTESSANQ